MGAQHHDVAEPRHAVTERLVQQTKEQRDRRVPRAVRDDHQHTPVIGGQTRAGSRERVGYGLNVQQLGGRAIPCIRRPS
jgi:hypothetical protein